MDELDNPIEYTDVPEEFREVQQSIDRFVEISYETASAMKASMHLSMEVIKGKMVDIIRNNPPLISVPKYFSDGREDWLWYSDFYDDVSKEVYHKYRTYTNPTEKITPANYAEELAKIELPYFKELVNLVSLERLYMEYESRVSKSNNEIRRTEKELPSEPFIIEQSQTVKLKQPKPTKRSYEPKLTGKQYALLAECIETIKLFRRPVKVTELKKLLKGKLSEPLQVTNQKSLVYLLDQLSEYKYIKETWVSVANGNKDFISFRTEGNRRRYGDEVHYIPMQQFLNDRKRNYKEAVRGLVEIEEMIEEMEESQNNQP